MVFFLLIDLDVIGFFRPKCMRDCAVMSCGWKKREAPQTYFRERYARVGWNFYQRSLTAPDQSDTLQRICWWPDLDQKLKALGYRSPSGAWPHISSTHFRASLWHRSTSFLMTRFATHLDGIYRQLSLGLTLKPSFKVFMSEIITTDLSKHLDKIYLNVILYKFAFFSF